MNIMVIEVGNVRFEMVQVQGGDFWIAETPITEAIWDAVMQDSKFLSESQLPKVNISFAAVNRFIKKLNEMNVVWDNLMEFRLPTGSEWVYAARGGRISRHYRYSGSNNIDDVAWYWNNSVPATQAGSHFYIGEPEIHAIKEKRPNELGIYDMSGNVWEWCSDGGTGKKHVCRGGCYESDKDECTVDSREFADSKGDCRIGFRLVLANR